GRVEAAIRGGAVQRAEGGTVHPPEGRRLQGRQGPLHPDQLVQGREHREGVVQDGVVQGARPRGGVEPAHRATETDEPPAAPPGPKAVTAQIIVLNHPSVITAGYTPVFHAHTAQVACTFEEIIAALDPKTGAPKPEKPDFLKTGDAARVKIRPTKPLVIEAFKQFPQMGRFAIRDMGQTVAAGQVIDVEKAK